MGVLKNVGGILTAGMALIFLKTAWRHFQTHDVAKPGERIIIDFVFAAVLGYCSYTLFQGAREHSRRLARRQREQEEAARGQFPPMS